MLVPAKSTLGGSGSTTANALATLTTSVNVSNAVAPPELGQQLEITSLSPLEATWGARLYHNVKHYGALVNGVLLNDCLITAGTNLANSASGGFANAIVGQVIEINKAGVSGAPFRTTITGINSIYQVTLAASASTTVTLITPGAGIAENITYYGSDDTAAIQAALNAAIEASHEQGGSVSTVLFPNGICIIDGALQDTSYSNAQLYLPALGYSDYRAKITIKLCGLQAPSPAFNDVGGAAITPAYGAVLKGTLNAGAGGAMFRPKTAYSDFHRAHVIIDNLICRMPENPVLSGFDLGFCVTAEVSNFIADCGNWNVPSIPNWTTPNSYGLKTPSVNNGAYSKLGSNVSVIGFYYGAAIGEHCTGDIAVWACNYPLVFPAGYHAIHLGRVLIAGSPHSIKITGVTYFEIEQLNIEHHYSADPSWVSPTIHDPINDIDDASNYGKGKITWHCIRAYVGYETIFTKNGGTGIRCEHLATGTVT